MKKVLPLIILTAGFMACGEHKQEAPEKKDVVCITDSLASMIRIDTAQISNIDDELKLSGEISFDENKVVKVFPFSSGQIQQVLVSLGDKVTKGQTLAVIKSAEVSGNYADLSSAGNDVAIAQKQMENLEALYKNGISSEKEYTEAKSNYQKAVTAQNKIKEQININGGGHTNAAGEYVLKSPMTGYVVEKKINPGGFIRGDNADNLFTIGDISDVWVWANVYESDISKVKEGYTAKVSTLAFKDTIFNGVIDKVSQTLDPETKVMKIRVRLPNSKLLLKPEMFANIIILNEEGKKTVTISTDAIVSDAGRNFVILYHDKCNLEIKEVIVLKTVGNKAYVTSGLKGGELMVAKNQVLLFNALKEAP